MRRSKKQELVKYIADQEKPSADFKVVKELFERKSGRVIRFERDIIEVPSDIPGVMATEASEFVVFEIQFVGSGLINMKYSTNRKGEIAFFAETLR